MAGFYTTDDLDFIVGLFGLIVSIAFLLPLATSYLQFRDAKFTTKVAIPIIICGYASMTLFMMCAFTLSIERMLLLSYDYQTLSENAIRSVAESSYIFGKLFLYLLFLARLHYSFQALPNLDYGKEVKIIFIVISVFVPTLFWVASMIVNWGDKSQDFQDMFEVFATVYYCLDAAFTMFALFLFNHKLNQLVTNKEITRQLTIQQEQNHQMSDEEIQQKRKLDKRSEKLVDTMVRYTVLVLVAVATSWVIVINFICVVIGVYERVDAYFFKSGTLLLVDTLVNFLCVWLNFKFSSSAYEILCECRCKFCRETTNCDCHGCLKRFYFKHNGFEYYENTNTKTNTTDTDTRRDRNTNRNRNENENENGHDESSNVASLEIKTQTSSNGASRLELVPNNSNIPSPAPPKQSDVSMMSKSRWLD